MKTRAHLIVSGVVQGVGFRYFVRQRAINLGLAGFVRNLFSGEVEIEAEGEQGMIEELLREVRVGPRSAQVTNIHIEWMPPVVTEQSGFEVR